MKLKSFTQQDGYRFTLIFENGEIKLLGIDVDEIMSVFSKIFSDTAGYTNQGMKHSSAFRFRRNTDFLF